MTTDIRSKVSAAMRAGTPIIAIVSYDPAATIALLRDQLEVDTNPTIRWDCINGWQSIGKASKPIIETLTKEGGQEATMSAIEQLELAKKLPGLDSTPAVTCTLFMLNAHEYFDQPSYNQAIWNLRDIFKADGRTLILLAPFFNLPASLKHDVVCFDEPLPTEEQLRETVNLVIDPVINEYKITVTDEDKERAVDALRGIAAFPAEQTVAMALSLEHGLDVDAVWERKRKMIDDTPGLKVYGGAEKFDDLGGCASVKDYLRRVISGLDAPRVIVMIDEGEKMFAGATNDVGDNTGVSQDMLATTLSFMEDHEADGAVFVGPPGAAKSAIAKAMGNEAGVPMIMLDFGAIKGSLVGESERKLREAYKIVDAVGGGRAYFIMTCNKDVALPPELKRRFTSGTFFFDLPSAEERDAIWPIYIKKYGLDQKQRSAVKDAGWTGAEIRNCCRMAYRQKISLAEAAQYIIPVAESASEAIEKLRQGASGKYLSASKPGKYVPEEHEATATGFMAAKDKAGRRLKLEGGQS